MTVKQIQEALYRKWNQHKYHLYNSYVYNWECDYFSMTREGVEYEVEIKLSRADFFADFKKDKHQVFKHKMLPAAHGYTFYRKTGDRHGDLITEYKWAELVKAWGNTKGFLDKHELHWHREIIYAKATSIQLVDVRLITAPHRFFYACPEGLIKKEELPNYAGLIYLTPCKYGYEGRFDAETIVKAPKLHFEKQNQNGTLLDKFYYDSVKAREKVRILEKEIASLRSQLKEEGETI